MKRSNTHRFRTIASGLALAMTVPAIAAHAAANPDEEIVVTAERREQGVQDIALPIQLFSGRTLERLGADKFEDYLLQVPGVSLRSQGNGASRIAIRGISNIAASDVGGGNTLSTVGLYLNDVPIQGTSVLPDLALYDVQRIEVLKGPQGTLYGEGAMGGAIKMQLTPPDMSATSARGEATLSTTDGATTLSHAARGVLNLPLAQDRVGLRLVGTYKSDAGFVNNIATGERDYNDRRSWSVRGILAANIAKGFDAELLVMSEHGEADGFDNIDRTLGDLRVRSAEDQQVKSDFNLIGLTLRGDLGFAELVSTSSYYTSERYFVERLPLIGAVFASIGIPGLRELPQSYESDLESFAQEVRLVSRGDGPLRWVLGGFFRDKTNDIVTISSIGPADVVTVNANLTARGLTSLLIAPGGFGLSREFTEDFRQISFYGEGTLEALPGVELTAGLRWFRERLQVRNDRTDTAAIFAALRATPPDISESENGIVPRFRVSWAPSDDALLYVSAAKGFRSAGINVNAVPPTQVGPPLFGSDDLWTYEFGVKTSWLENRLTLNASLFRSDWSDIQGTQTAISPTLGTPASFTGNAGDARIEGVEIEAAFTPVPALSLYGNLGYLDGTLIRTTGLSVAGARLPNAPEWTASGGIEYRAEIDGGAKGFVRFDVQHVGRQFSRLVTIAEPTGQPLRAYTLGQVRAGIDLESGWGATLFIDNLWNKRAELGRGYSLSSTFSNPERYSVARPRTIGLVVRGQF